MRIGVNCFLLEGHVGGIKQYFLTLFDWLLDNDLDNDYVLFHSERNLGELEKLRSPRWRPHAELLSAQDQIAEHLSGLDLYFCPFNSLWPRPVSIPSVVTLVDIQEVFHPQFFSAEDLRYRAFHYPASTRAADRVITISAFSKASIAKYHGVRKSKIVVAHLCANPLYSEASTIATPPEPPLPFQRFLLYPANRWHHKNHDTLLRALRILKARGNSANVVLTGFDVPGGYSIPEKAFQYGVSDCVYSAGYVTVDQMAYLYRSAEMTVFPSLFEGFGIPVVEAMAVGCPVVVARSSSLPAICRDAAEYFEPTDAQDFADAILRVRGNAKQRKKLIERGQLRAKSFSVDSMAQAHLRAFDEAVHSYSDVHFPSHNRSAVSWQSKEVVKRGLQILLQLWGKQTWSYRLCRLEDDIRVIESSGLFHENFYESQRRHRVGPSIGHYLSRGARLGIDPNPLFSTSWYVAQNPDVAASRLNPLIHYVRWGATEGRNPHPLFEASFYLSAIQDSAQARLNPLAHYLAQSPANAKDPHPLFDGAWYLKQNADVAAAGVNPLVHYLTYGALEGRDPNPSFDTAEYLSEHPDLRATRMNPLVHYLQTQSDISVALSHRIP